MSATHAHIGRRTKVDARSAETPEDRARPGRLAGNRLVITLFMRYLEQG